MCSEIFIMSEVAEVSSESSKKVNLLNLDHQMMREFLASLGEKPFRADQLMKWIYQQGESDFEKMSNLNKNLRAMLIENCEIKAPEIAYF